MWRVPSCYGSLLLIDDNVLKVLCKAPILSVQHPENDLSILWVAQIYIFLKKTLNRLNTIYLISQMVETMRKI